MPTRALNIPEAPELGPKTLKRLAKKRSFAEAYLNEPLTIYVRRALRAGTRPPEIARMLRERTSSRIDLSANEIIWLAHQPVPSQFIRPDKPRRAPDRDHDRDYYGVRGSGFWDAVRTSGYMQNVSGGAPGLGRRR